MLTITGCFGLSLSLWATTDDHNATMVTSSSDIPSLIPTLSAECDQSIENFSADTPGRFPSRWKVFQHGRLRPVTESSNYWVEQAEQVRLLHGVSDRDAITIAIPIAGWDLDEHPILQWQWLAKRLPKDGDESRLRRNDSAASVYVVWQAGFLMKVRSLRYSWSSTVPVGTQISRRFGYNQITVVETGDANLNSWRTVRINVREDYLNRFGISGITPPDAIALLTDSDSTRTSAESYYAEFKRCRR